MMSHLVEEVAEPDHARSLTGEVHRQPRGAAADQTCYGIQFLAATAEIVPGHNEIGGAEGGICRKQKAIVTIPKSVIARRFR